MRMRLTVHNIPLINPTSRVPLPRALEKVYNSYMLNFTCTNNITQTQLLNN